MSDQVLANPGCALAVLVGVPLLLQLLVLYVWHGASSSRRGSAQGSSGNVHPAVPRSEVSSASLTRPPPSDDELEAAAAAAAIDPAWLAIRRSSVFASYDELEIYKALLKLTNAWQGVRLHYRVPLATLWSAQVRVDEGCGLKSNVTGGTLQFVIADLQGEMICGLDFYGSFSLLTAAERSQRAGLMEYVQIAYQAWYYDRSLSPAQFMAEHNIANFIAGALRYRPAAHQAQGAGRAPLAVLHAYIVPPEQLELAKILEPLAARLGLRIFMRLSLPRLLGSDFYGFPKSPADSIMSLSDNACMAGGMDRCLDFVLTLDTFRVCCCLQLFGMPGDMECPADGLMSQTAGLPRPDLDAARQNAEPWPRPSGPPGMPDLNAALHDAMPDIGIPVSLMRAAGENTAALAAEEPACPDQETVRNASQGGSREFVFLSSGLRCLLLPAHRDSRLYTLAEIEEFIGRGQARARTAEAALSLSRPSMPKPRLHAG